MAYLALYRRYRPTGFHRLIGQNHIVKILKNQIREDRVGHAYLFTGARGTGKTSAAKIFARAINCLQPQDGSPCGVCEACKALSESNNMDILEIDAASNNRVDEVREIREKVQYPPVTGRYKVYIIDEVHMLTDSAFNALLKTLEEPPPHAVFILATTEPQKLPPTILSRCMRFDFRLISESAIAELIEGIFKEIGLEYEPEAVRLIAKSGEGSVRDALSLADKCVSIGEGKLRYQDVLEVLGGADRGRIVLLAKAMLTGSVGTVLTGIDELVGLGKSIAVLSKDLAGFYRDLAVVKSVPEANAILGFPEEKYSELNAIASGEDIAHILRCLELFAGIEQELRHSLNPRILLETTALKCARAQNDLSADGLLRRMNQMEKQLSDLKAGGLRMPQPVEPQAASKKAPTEKAPEAVPQATAKVAPTEKAPMEENIAVSRKAPTEKAPAEKPEAVVKVAPTEKAPMEENAAATRKAPTEKAWAELLRTVRKSTNRLLFNIIKSAEAEVRGNVLTIVSGDEGAAPFLKKPEMIAQCKKILQDLGYDMDVAVRLIEESPADTFTEDVERVKQVLGIKDITIK